MDKDELIINAILDKYSASISIYNSDDILKAAGINEVESSEIYAKIKNFIIKTTN